MLQIKQTPNDKENPTLSLKNQSSKHSTPSTCLNNQQQQKRRALGDVLNLKHTTTQSSTPLITKHQQPQCFGKKPTNEQEPQKTERNYSNIYLDTFNDILKDSDKLSVGLMNTKSIALMPTGCENSYMFDDKYRFDHVLSDKQLKKLLKKPIMKPAEYPLPIYIDEKLDAELFVPPSDW